MARQLIVALTACMGTIPMRPTVLARKWGAGVGAVGAIGVGVAAVAATRIGTIVPIGIVVPIVVVVGAAVMAVAHERHEITHLVE